MDIKPVIHKELSPLTPKENLQLDFIAQGKMPEQIKHIIHRELSTIKTQRKSMMQKLGAGNALEALAIAVAKGIVTYQKNVLAVVMVGVSSVAGVVPDTAYSSPLDDGSVHEQPFVRVGSRSVRGRGRVRRREGDVGDDEGLSLAER